MPKPKKSTKPTDKARLDFLSRVHVEIGANAGGGRMVLTLRGMFRKPTLRQATDAAMSAERRDKKKARG